jgi:hypothetical protein
MSQSRAKRSGYGSPLSTPKPGTTTRRRPKPGDKDPSYKPPKKKPGKRRKKPAPRPKKPAPKKPSSPLIERYDDGKPVGKGGEDRSTTIMERVDEAQSGKKKKKR